MATFPDLDEKQMQQFQSLLDNYRMQRGRVLKGAAMGTDVLVPAIEFRQAGVSLAEWITEKVG